MGKKTIELSRDNFEEAIKEYLSLRGITFNVDEIYCKTDHNGELEKVYIECR